MEENKDELLQAFENPDMANMVETENTSYENVEPAYEVQPETYVETPVETTPTQAQSVEQNEISQDVMEQYAPVTPEVNFMPEEFQQALNQEEVTKAPEENLTEPVETPVDTVAEVPTQEMQNVPENLNPEPVVSVTQDIKEENNNEEEDNISYKKILIFLAPIVLVMIIFILVLPLITKI